MGAKDLEGDERKESGGRWGQRMWRGMGAKDVEEVKMGGGHTGLYKKNNVDGKG